MQPTHNYIVSDKMRKKDFTLSIITPFYNEEEGGMIDVYFAETTKELEKITKNWSIIAIDDGSADNTYDILKSYHLKDKRIKVLKLSRNFGKEAALTAGIDYADADVTIPMDADLQHPPKLIKDMVKLWQDGYDVVIPIRKNRDSIWLQRISIKIFYLLIKKISGKSPIIEHAGDFRLLDRKVLLATKNLKEYHRFMKGLLSWSGFKVTVIEYDVSQREFGKTKFNIVQLITLAMDGIFSFSTAPIRLITFSGAMLALLSFIYGFTQIYQKIIFGTDVSGYTSIIVVVLFLGGANLISLGIIGEYIGRIYDEVKQRPIYVIDEEHL